MGKSTNRIVKIFMERDGLTYGEAYSCYESLKKQLYRLLEELDPAEAYEEITDELSLYCLEPDYIEDLI